MSARASEWCCLTKVVRVSKKFFGRDAVLTYIKLYLHSGTLLIDLCPSIAVAYPYVYAYSTRPISSPIVDGGGQQPQHHSSASALGQNPTQSIRTEMGLCSKHPETCQTPPPSLVLHGLKLRHRVPTLELGAAYVMQARSITSPRLT